MNRDAHGLYRFRSAGFILIQVLLESAERGASREQRYQVLSGKLTDGDLLGRMFRIFTPTSLEMRTYFEIAGTAQCIEARNKTLVKIIHLLSPPGGIDVWINDPRNDAYVQHWVSATAKWALKQWSDSVKSLSSTLLFRCDLLFDPPTVNNPSNFWQSKDAQQAFMAAVVIEWVTHNRRPIPSKDLRELVERTVKIMAKITPANAAATACQLDGMLPAIPLYVRSGGDSQVAAKLEAMIMAAEEIRIRLKPPFVYIRYVAFTLQSSSL